MIAPKERKQCGQEQGLGEGVEKKGRQVGSGGPVGGGGGGGYDRVRKWELKTIISI